MVKPPTDDHGPAIEERGHKRMPHDGEVKKVTGDLEQEIIAKQRATQDNQRKWLNGMQDELKKGER